ncbi:MAG: hypothetical protein GKS00_00085 [Alphaproteobacteria bacterium]|nr:hypothetical protein [Alphaproteobacteria bacterium]
MIARHEVLLSLYGAWRLFLRDPRGLEWLDTSIEGFWKSFFCAVIVLPGYILWIAFASSGTGDAGFFRIVTVEGITYVIQWTAWPLLMAYLAPTIDRDEYYIRYIVAYNWSAGIQIAIYMIVLVVKFTGTASDGFLVTLGFVATVIILSYQWYVARVGLEVSGVGAAGIVAGEFVLGQIIHAIGQSMLQ